MNSFGVDVARYAVANDDGVAVVDDVSIAPDGDDGIGASMVLAAVDGPASVASTSSMPADFDVGSCAMATTVTGDVSCLPAPHSPFVMVGGGTAVQLADDAMELEHTVAVAFSAPSILFAHIDSAMI